MKRFFAFLSMILWMVILLPRVSALGTLPEPNSEPRHVACASLSDEAKEYYTGEYSYSSLSSLSGASDISTGYTAMLGNELFDALHALMTDTHKYHTTYSGYGNSSLAYYWNSTDAVSGSDSYVMFYSDIMGGSDGAKLNREHIWPKSRASYGTKNGGADLHHLRPAVASVNQAKSNHTFGNILGVYTDGCTERELNGEVCYRVRTASDLFECKDDVKGDVARILLYVYCRWEQPNLYADIPAHLLPAADSDSAGNSGVKVIESLDTLLNWCAEDPVDTWELRRNDLVERVQGNRNVFIDYPELAWRLFGMDAPAGMTTPSSGSVVRYLGDADSDGELTVLDVTVIQRRIAGIYTASFDETAADVDEDEEVTILDATWILRGLSGVAQPYGIGERI